MLLLVDGSAIIIPLIDVAISVQIDINFFKCKFATILAPLWYDIVGFTVKYILIFNFFNDATD